MVMVVVATECVEDIALAVYNGNQKMVRIKGVDDNFTELTHINDILLGNGQFDLHAGNLEYGTPGVMLAQEMGLGARWNGYLHIYAPVKDGQIDISDPTQGFVVDSLISSGVVFCVKQSKYDRHYIVTSTTFARNLFGMQGMLTSLELRLKDNCNFNDVKKKIQDICGDKYTVRDRFEQQEDTFRIMQIEKVIAYIFLTFILIVACFNIIGSLSMLIIDKKDNIVTLRNLGATDRQITRIFLYEGRMISAIGAVVGIALGLLLCWLQQEYGIVRMGDSDGTFVVNAYPVSVHYSDVLSIFITVLAVGWVAAWYPVHRISGMIDNKGE